MLLGDIWSLLGSVGVTVEVQVGSGRGLGSVLGVSWAIFGGSWEGLGRAWEDLGGDKGKVLKMNNRRGGGGGYFDDFAMPANVC